MQQAPHEASVACIDDHVLSMQLTSALAEIQDDYAVALPEKLTPDGPWLVRRHVSVFRMPRHSNSGHPHATTFDTNRHRRSMTKLVTTFSPPADHITTLYDNLEHSIKQYPNVRSDCTASGWTTPMPGRSHTWASASSCQMANAASTSGRHTPRQPTLAQPWAAGCCTMASRLEAQSASTQSTDRSGASSTRHATPTASSLCPCTTHWDQTVWNLSATMPSLLQCAAVWSAFQHSQNASTSAPLSNSWYVPGACGKRV